MISAVLMGTFVTGDASMLTSGVSRVKLDNGLVLIHKKTGPLPIISVNIFLMTGSTSDPQEKLGLMNLVQTLLTKGTRTRSSEQIAVEIESIGGSLGAGCSEDYSSVGLTITKKHLAKGMELLADVFFNPAFPEEELTKEKYMTDISIKTRHDRIFNVAFDLMMENLYGSHPYKNLVQGSTMTLQNITREDVVNRHRQTFGLPNVLITVSGNIGLSETKKLLKKYFSDIQSVSPPQPFYPAPEIKNTNPVQKKKFEQAYLMTGFRVPSVNSPDYIKLKLLNAWLGGGMSSLLFQELREKAGLGYEVHSFYPTRKEESHFVIYIGLDETSIPVAKEKISALLEDLKNKTIDAEKLREIKNYLRGTYLLDHQTSGRQGWYLGWWEVLGKGYGYDDEYLSEIEKLTEKDLQDAARKYFDGERVVVEVIPEKTAAGADPRLPE